MLKLSTKSRPENQSPAAGARPPVTLLLRVCLVVFASVPTLLADGPSGPSFSLPSPARLSDFDRRYEWAQSAGTRTRGGVYGDNLKLTWFGPKQDKFWYRVRIDVDQHRYVVVDLANANSPKVPFDDERLAKALADATGKRVAAAQLDLRSLKFSDDATSCRFVTFGSSWQFTLPAGPLEKAEADESGSGEWSEGLVARGRVQRSRNGGERTDIRFENRTDQSLEYFWVDSSGGLRSYGKVPARQTRGLSTFDGHAWLLRNAEGDDVAAFVASSSSELAIVDTETPKPEPFSMRRRDGRSRPGNSPDGKWQIVFEDHNVVRLNRETRERLAITSDGSQDNAYGGRVHWAPDSSAFVVMKTKPGQRRNINLIESSPKDSIHAKLHTMGYAKPGDRLDKPQIVLFRVDDFEPVAIDDDLYSNPFHLTDLRWNQDSSSFSFLYNQRGHQVLRLIEVDAATANARTVIDEAAETFVCYSHKKFLRCLDETNEILWMSERSGWNHLYLIDAESGEIKHPVTSGQWVVRSVERVDTKTRQVWLTVSGIDAGQDPYHRHLVRVDFDGNHLTRLTHGDGDHQWEFSSDQQYIIDTYSRVDLPPVTQIVDARTGELLVELERAVATEKIDSGWRYPERFVAKGRDGKTDIYGFIIRPTHFDPSKKYPVLEAIYAGPHSAFVPKRFGSHTGLYQMADLGFIIVKIDGMGTSHRSKAFHDVCWQNLGDSGFADRIAWMKAAAKERPEMDLSRVGIWGGSAGGQSAMRALVAHGNFYKAAVADCGCHDNRVDKVWWNEQWMGWPIGPHYEVQSNVTCAHQLQGDLLLIWGELDRNVDPASTMQVIDALIKANKNFEQLIMPGVGHGAAGHPYAKRRQAEFFCRKLGDREQAAN